MAGAFISYSVKRQAWNVFVAETCSLYIKYINWGWKESFYFFFLEAAQLELYIMQLSCSFVNLSMAVLLNAREIGEGGNLAFCFI